MRYAIFLGLFFVPKIAFGQTIGVSTQLVSTVLSLIFVLLLIVGLAYFVKRLNPNLVSNEDLKVIRSLPLGTKERLLVIEIDKKQHLLGVTPHNINYLYQLETPLEKQKVNAFSNEISRFLSNDTRKNKSSPND